MSSAVSDISCGQRGGRLSGAGGTHLRRFEVLQGSGSEAASAGDEQVEHRPGQAQAARLAGEPGGHVGYPTHLAEFAARLREVLP